MHNAPSIAINHISFLSILKVIPFNLKKIIKRRVAIPKRKNANERGEISEVTYLAATGVSPAAKVK